MLRWAGITAVASSRISRAGHRPTLIARKPPRPEIRNLGIRPRHGNLAAAIADSQMTDTRKVELPPRSGTDDTLILPEPILPEPTARLLDRISKIFQCVHFSDVLLPVSIALYAVGVHRARVPATPAQSLLSYLPLLFYAAIGLLLVSAVIELRERRISEWRMAAHAVGLVVMLYATAPLVYPEGRYGWLYKTIGVVQYVSAHGQLNGQIDIYQNWPGFFALGAWFDKIAGFASPLAYAKWAQAFFELAALPLLYLIYDGLRLTVRQRWIAVLLYASANWISQDYYSPQALGVVLSLGIMAIAIRWLYTPRLSGVSGSKEPSSGRQRWWGFPPELSLPRALVLCGVIIFVYFVLSMTHQLSPYILVLQLGALAVTGMLRPRWLPVALLAIAVGYLLPRFSFVSAHYGLLQSFGSFFSNAKPPSIAGLSTVSPGEKLIERSSELLSLGIWSLGLLGAWLRRRSGQPALGLLALAFSPIVVLVFQAYGNEGLLRVYLFSLPWTAALAASALVPRIPQSAAALIRSRLPLLRQIVAGRHTILGLAALVIAVSLFLPAFFGDDSYNVMSTAEVNTLTAFESHAPPGIIYVVTENGPFNDTSRYELFPIVPIFGPSGFLPATSVRSDIAAKILRKVLDTTSRSKPVYVVMTPNMISYNRDFGAVLPDTFAILQRSLAHTRPWTLVSDRDGTIIYELPRDTLPVIGNARCQAGTVSNHLPASASTLC